MKIGDWALFSNGDKAEYIKSIEEDGMYNVFRLPESQGFAPIYTDEHFNTGYGIKVVNYSSKQGNI